MARRASPRVLTAGRPWVGLGSRGTALLLAAGLALTGCGGDDEQPTAERSDDSSPTSDATSQAATPTPTTDVDVPAGVKLTDPGTRLAFGETARVAYEVRPPTGDKGSTKGSGTRKRTTGTVLALTVESARKGSLADLAGFDLKDPYQRKASYYYVRVTVRNLGERRFGDVEVPLWGISGENTLLPPVRFTSAFSTCPTEALPAGFAPGARLQTCLVFLSPDKGSLEGVSYRPTEDDTPIEWHGKVAAPKAAGAEDDRRGRRSGG
jgi:hypothetical protein